ncbi:MAG: DUF4837 family protein [Longimicrobiales bacterium]
MRFLRLVSVLLILSACGDRPPSAYGDPNSVIMLAQQELWVQVADTLERALAPRVFTVRDERTFRLTHVEPTDPAWGRLRQFRQILLIGRPSDPWIQEALEHADSTIGPPPTVFEARNVWVNGQVVTAAVVATGREVSGAIELLPEIHERLDARFRTYAVRRMYSSGVDSALADTLRRAAGFALLLPEVYRATPVDSGYLFRNDALTTGRDDLVRSVLVTWRAGTARPQTAEQILEWRDTVAQRHYARPMVTLREPLRADTVRTAAGPAFELQGIWETPAGGWPGGGPFVARIVHCPQQGRTYLIDAWLYAPGEDKYEYMLQLWTALGTFECGAAA